MYRLACVALLGASLAVTTRSEIRAQEPDIEYGSAADLQGITKIYVNTGEDLDTRDNILRIILRELPMLTVTARSGNAEVILIFRTDESTAYAGTSTTRSSEAEAEAHRTAAGAQATAQETSREHSFALYQTTVAGSGKVFRITPEGHTRLILTYQGSKVKGTIWKKPRTRFAEKFIDAYRQANPQNH